MQHKPTTAKGEWQTQGLIGGTRKFMAKMIKDIKEGIKSGAHQEWRKAHKKIWAMVKMSDEQDGRARGRGRVAETQRRIAVSCMLNCNYNIVAWVKNVNHWILWLCLPVGEVVAYIYWLGWALLDCLGINKFVFNQAIQKKSGHLDWEYLISFSNFHLFVKQYFWLTWEYFWQWHLPSLMLVFNPEIQNKYDYPN